MNKVCLFLILGLVIQSLTSVAQNNYTSRVSPLVETEGKVGQADIVIQYSSPAVKGREIWGGLVPYGKIWRTGANEASVFSTDEDLKIQDKVLPKGKYSLFTIPGEEEWVIVFNSVWDQWGAFKYDESRDVLRVTVKPSKVAAFYEQLSLGIENRSIVLRWENIEVACKLATSKA